MKINRQKEDLKKFNLAADAYAELLTWAVPILRFIRYLGSFAQNSFLKQKSLSIALSDFSYYLTTE
ncbi:hypothetical protein P9684_10535 [Bacillus atrophaeus]|uniref:hypothetical protein n=1 Tax=Bacillus atrophaeus TaxID=1452 RepID=UPI00077AA82C|nr:hypothetical protein [Bacillus atrophaeus]KXZ12884.1 hypothetical protein AXI57_16890 [Bacillus atrophaeus]MCY8836724.1 hypothetical protein [Bacillus atrophaeus]MEC5222556.1 hypothetical protein [Bacillus atrophaeus]MED4578627.1 hypothetical protein [Bacillus atrophaeus]MED4722328.1 hypothetical protein [Bacillus atrophaeus]